MQTALLARLYRQQNALITRPEHWQAALKRWQNLQKNLCRNNQIFDLALLRLKADQVIGLCDQGRNCDFKQI